MARHFTWSLKRTFLLTKRLNFHLPTLPHRFTSDVTALQKFPSLKEMNDESDDPKDFKEFSEGSEWAGNQVADVLTKILSISKHSAAQAVKRYPAFSSLPRKSIAANFEILRQAEIRKSTIIENKYLLTDETCELTKKIKLVKKLDMDINDCICLFNLSSQKLTRAANLMKLDATCLPHRNRILYLAERFDDNIGSICRFLSYNHHILLMAAPKLLSITEFLLESGVAPEHIMSDPVAYKYEFSLIKEKVAFAKKSGIKPLKTWVIRCQAKILDRSAKKHGGIGKASPYQTIEDFLCEMFDCDREEVDVLYFKCSSIATINYKKIMANSILLRAEGYTIQHIQRSPFTLHRKHETLARLLQVWRESGLPRIPLCLFAYSEKRLSELLNKRASKDEKFIATS